MLDGVTNSKYKLLPFLTKKNFKVKKALAFNRDRCGHLALCLQLILFHYLNASYKETSGGQSCNL
jgi:hypothetical protein